MPTSPTSSSSESQVSSSHAYRVVRHVPAPPTHPSPSSSKEASGRHRPSLGMDPREPVTSTTATTGSAAKAPPSVHTGAAQKGGDGDPRSRPLPPLPARLVHLSSSSSSGAPADAVQGAEGGGGEPSSTTGGSGGRATHQNTSLAHRNQHSQTPTSTSTANLDDARAVVVKHEEEEEESANVWDAKGTSATSVSSSTACAVGERGGRKPVKRDSDMSISDDDLPGTATHGAGPPTKQIPGRGMPEGERVEDVGSGKRWAAGVHLSCALANDLSSSSSSSSARQGVASPAGRSSFSTAKVDNDDVRGVVVVKREVEEDEEEEEGERDAGGGLVTAEVSSSATREVAGRGGRVPVKRDSDMSVDDDQGGGAGVGGPPKVAATRPPPPLVPPKSARLAASSFSRNPPANGRPPAHPAQTASSAAYWFPAAPNASSSSSGAPAAPPKRVERRDREFAELMGEGGRRSASPRVPGRVLPGIKQVMAPPRLQETVFVYEDPAGISQVMAPARPQETGFVYEDPSADAGLRSRRPSDSTGATRRRGVGPARPGASVEALTASWGQQLPPQASFVQGSSRDGRGRDSGQVRQRPVSWNGSDPRGDGGGMGRGQPQQRILVPSSGPTNAAYLQVPVTAPYGAQSFGDCPHPPTMSHHRQSASFSGFGHWQPPANLDAPPVNISRTSQEQSRLLGIMGMVGHRRTVSFEDSAGRVQEQEQEDGGRAASPSRLRGALERRADGVADLKGKERESRQSAGNSAQQSIPNGTPAIIDLTGDDSDDHEDERARNRHGTQLPAQPPQRPNTVRTPGPDPRLVALARAGVRYNSAVYANSFQCPFVRYVHQTQRDGLHAKEPPPQTQCPFETHSAGILAAHFEVKHAGFTQDDGYLKRELGDVLAVQLYRCPWYTPDFDASEGVNGPPRFRCSFRTGELREWNDHAREHRRRHEDEEKKNVEVAGDGKKRRRCARCGHWLLKTSYALHGNAKYCQAMVEVDPKR